MRTSNFYYIPINNAELFTVCCLPETGDKFPVVICRSPYVDYYEFRSEEEACADYLKMHKSYLDKGYAVVLQHCRGRGKSSGDCVPYIYEREDSLNLQQWVREQPFYNGEIYLVGCSYTASVHFVTSPFASDIKGAVLQVQDCERYNCNYRNGFYKMGLHGSWYADMYKKKSIREKNYSPESFHLLPLIDFSQAVLGESSDDFDEILLHPDRDDPFWNTRYGGGEAHNAVKKADIPILFTTGFYDIYTGGVFDMWNGLEAGTKKQCALLVHPYDHGCNPDGQPIQFPNGHPGGVFGDYAVQWMEYIRGKNNAPVEPGKVTYYKLFGEQWCTDDFAQPEKQIRFRLGEGEKTYTYNPFAPASFPGGLSANSGGSAWQAPPNSRYDIVSLFTPEFTEDTFVKGKMTASLCVRSDCEDTCFYIRLSLEKPEGYYGLRDDIQKISNFKADYKPGEEIQIDFSFDEHAFVVQKGERLRIDISSSAFPHYVRHTNQKGPYALQKTAIIAHNTVMIGKSVLNLPIA